MRLLVSALLAASVSFAAFAPAQACYSACGGGGGGSSTSTPTSSSTGTSSSPSESGDSGNHGVPGAGDSAIDVFVEVQSRPLLNVDDPSVTLEQAMAALDNETNAMADFMNAITSRFVEDDEPLYDGFYWRFGRAGVLVDAIIARWGEEALYGDAGDA